MNSEISSLLKLSPVTVVKTDKPTDERLSSGVKENSVVFGSALAAPPTSESLAFPSKTIQDDNNKAESKPSLDLVKKAADQGNSFLQAVNRNLQFKVDESTKELVVKIVDSDSGKMVRQIPSDEMLAFIRRMQELEGRKGSVLQERA